MKLMETGMQHRGLARIGLIFMIGMLFLMTYPGLLSSDSQTIQEEAKHWVFNSGHPPIMGITWGLLNFIREGTALMLVAQLTLFASGVYLVVRNLFSERPVAVQMLVIAITLFSPMVFSIVGVLWKDIWSTAYMLVAFGLLFSLYRSGKRVWLTVGLIFLTSYLAILFRPNTVGAVIACLGGVTNWFIARRWPSSRVILQRIGAFCVGLVLSLILVVAGDKFDTTVGAGVPKAGLYFFDIAGIVSNSKHQAELAKHIQDNFPLMLRDKDQFIPMLNDSFMPYTAVSLNVEWGNDRSPFVLPFTEENLKHYDGAWRYVLEADPAAYFRYRLEYVKYLLGFYIPPGAGRNGWVLADQSETKNARFLHYVGSFERTNLFAGYLWLLFCGIAAIRLFRKDSASTMNSPLGWFGLAGFGIVGVLFFVGPAPDYRYTMIPIVFGMLCAMYLISDLVTWVRTKVANRTT